MPPGHVDALHLGAVLRIAQHLLGGDDAGLEDLLVVVDVVDEGIERAHALLESAFERIHSSRQDARHDVERDQALRAFLLAVDREGDADAVEQRIGLGALLRQALGRLLPQPLRVAQVMGARSAVADTSRYTVCRAKKLPPLRLQ